MLRYRTARLGVGVGAWLVLLLAGCGGGSGGGGGSVTPPVNPQPNPGAPAFTIEGADPLPGVTFALVGTSGGTGAGGTFQPGDFVTVQFTLKSRDGTTLDLSLMDSGSAYLSGPTSNYNRVIPRQNDLRSSIYLGNATWQYTFPVAIPPVFAAPYNDTAAFGTFHGELTGQPLVAGTYSIGLETSKVYTVDGADHRDPGALVVDILLLGATTLDTREVVTDEHCNQCHTEVRGHGDRRVGVRLCLLCHTSGAEDKNDNLIEGGTPGVSIDFKVMAHKLHAGKHLPSVLGMTTSALGARVYGAGTPYKLVGNSTLDASGFGFPVMPSAYVAYLFDQAGVYTGTGGNGPMPRDVGYAALTPSQKLAEDTMRTGPVACAKCHGDPDGAGPITAPAHGHLHEDQPSAAACGSCHDDVDWAKPYAANGDVMIAIEGNPGAPACAACHPASTTGAGLFPVRQSHLHPYSNPVLNTGVNVLVQATGAVSGGTGTGGRHIAGDPLAVTFSVRNDANTDVSIHSLQRFQAIATGPTSNPQSLAANVTLFDSGFRKSSPFAGTGSVSNLSVGAGALDEVLALIFTATRTFDVVGSVSGPLLTGQVVPDGGNLTLTTAGVTFRVNDTGATDFAAGDRFYLEVVPTAPTYTRHIPTDVSFELLGQATGAAQTLNVANLPLYWGRQVLFERTALVGSAVPLGASSAYLGRFVVVDASLPGISALAVGDRVVLDDGLGAEEYLQVGRIQTLDDVTGADLGALDRVWFTTALRFAHGAGASLQEATLTTRAEGTAYTVTNPSLGSVALTPGQFSAGNRVVASYRTHLRFGRLRYPGDVRQDIYPDPVADSDAVDASAGDWKGLQLLAGTYTVGFWVNRDFTVTGNLPPAGEATSYRMISPPASTNFLFGAGTLTLSPRTPAADDAACNACHTEVTFHGNGRRGLGTCLLCHTVSGMEDGPKYTFSAWPQAKPTPGVAMEFRSLLHKVHHGKELSQPTEAVGVFLGVPYPAVYNGNAFPSWPAETAHCEKCHGAGSTAWHAPQARSHPSAMVPVRAWRTACGSCHDSTLTQAHIDTNTSPSGYEACEVCHGPGREADVVRVHPLR